jgi:hypothetical protein
MVDDRSLRPADPDKRRMILRSIIGIGQSKGAW